MTSTRNKRVGLGVVDQALSSSSNMLAVFAMAGVSTVPEFGVISLAIAMVMAMVALCRGLLGTPISLLSGEPAHLAAETNHALALSGILGVLVGLVIAGASLFVDDPWPLILIAVASPAILVQDSARFACIAAGRPVAALVSDGVWTLGSALLFVIAGWGIPSMTPSEVVGTWVAFALLAAVIIFLLSGSRLDFGGMATWLRSTAPHRFRFGISSGIGAASSILFLLVVAALIGSSAIAALRGAASVMGPLSILLTSMTLVVVPELRRAPSASPAYYWRPMRKAALVMCVIPLAAGILSVIVPDAWGEVILGPTWSVAQPLLPITAVEYIALAWTYSADAILKAQGNSRAVLTLQIVRAALITAGATVAAVVFGSALAVAVGLAVGALVATLYGVSRTLDRP